MPRPGAVVPAEDAVEVHADGTATVTLAGVTTRVSGADAAQARSRALAVVVAEAQRTGAPVPFVAIDDAGRRQMAAHPDRSVRLIAAASASSSPAPLGRRVSKLPAAGEVLQVPKREDTGTAVRGTPHGSPADTPVTARPVSSHDPIVPGPAEGLAIADGVAPARPRRRGLRWGVAAALLVPTVAVGGLVVRAQTTGTDERSAAQSQDQALDEARSLADRQRAVALEQAQDDLAARRKRIRDLLTTAAEVLGASQGRVADDATRQALAAQIDELNGLLEGGSPSTWAAEAATVSATIDKVRAEQAAWEAAEQARIAAEQAAADQARVAAEQEAAAAAARAAGGGRAPATSHPAAANPGGSAGAPAAPPTPPSTSGSVTAITAHLSSGTGTVSISVQVSTSGPAEVSVSASVAGQPVTLTGPGTVNGSATFTGSLSGLPAGTHPWTASAGGVSTSGQIEVF